MKRPKRPRREFDFLIIGDLNVDVIFGGMAALPALGTEEIATELDFRTGGSSANCARTAAALGAKVAFAGLIGDDRFGDFALDSLRAAGINTDFIRRSPTVRTGATVSLSLAHDRAFATHLGALAELSLDHLDEAAFGRARHLHCGGYFLLSGMRPHYRELLGRAKTAGMSTSLDCGWDPQQRWNGGLAATLDLVDVFLPNEVEALHIAGADNLAAAVGRLAARIPTVAVKLGEAGAIGRQGDTEARAPAFAVEVADTTALGDCFNAGFLVAYLEERLLVDCLKAGNATAAIAASRLGDNRYATGEEMAAMLSAHQRP